MSKNSIELDKLNMFLQNENADYSIFIDTSSISTASAGAEHYDISLDETTPTLILKTKEKYIAAIICSNTRISFKKLKQALGIKDINMADPQTVFNVTGAKVGEVSMINGGLTTLIDTNVLKNENCTGGCGIPNATLRISAHDLVRITNAQIMDFTEPRCID